MRGWYTQLQIYLLLAGQEPGVIIIKNKSSGALCFMPSMLDLDVAEEAIKKAEKVNEALRKNELPDRIPFDSKICGDCPFFHICNPTEVLREVEIENDTELAEMLERLEELESAKKEYDRINKLVKERIKGKDKVIVGSFYITGKWVTRKAYQVKESTYWQPKIERIVPPKKERRI
jgi:hypothetical protein